MTTIRLRRVQQPLGRLPMAQRLRWMPVVRCMESTFWRQSAWLVLDPLLEGPDRQEAIHDAVSIAIEDGAWSSNPDRWDLLPAEELPAMTLRLVRTASGGWGRDELITHITNDRPEEAERCFLPVLEDLSAVDPDRRLEALSALSPWLATVTEGGFAARVAGLDFPAAEKPPDRHLRERRMFAAGR